MCEFVLYLKSKKESPVTLKLFDNSGTIRDQINCGLFTLTSSNNRILLVCNVIRSDCVTCALWRNAEKGFVHKEIGHPIEQ